MYDKIRKFGTAEELGNIGGALLSFWLSGVASSKINEKYYEDRVKAERRNIKSALSAQKVRMLAGSGMTMGSILRETEMIGQLNIEAIRHERSVAKAKAVSRRTQSKVERYDRLEGRLLRGGGGEVKRVRFI